MGNLKNEPLKICNAVIQPGEISSLALPMPEIFNYTPMYMPIRVTHGKIQGPTVLIVAAIHGDELNGIEIINRLINLSLIKKIKGTLITVPIFNVYGFLTRSRYLSDGLELDQYFPGSESGSYASRLTNLFISEVFNKADYCLDLRTGYVNHSNLPQVITTIDNDVSLGLATAFRAPVIRNATGKQGSIQSYARSKNIPYLQYEAGEALHFNEYAIKVGLKGIVNLLRYLQIIPPLKKLTKKMPIPPFVAKETSWIRAPKSGFAHTTHLLGQQINKGEQIAIIKDPFGASDDIDVVAPYSGIVIGRNNLPIVHEGETLIQLATFKKHSSASDVLEDWHDQSKEYIQKSTESGEL